jgi:pimeloyl-ACP methyl ester carboxylesterase
VSATVPPRPPAWEERAATRLFLALSPRTRRTRRTLKTVQPEPPAALAPWRNVQVPRRDGNSQLAATWYEAAGQARGAVLLVHPWVPAGRAYFHRRGRIPALRAAGYHALALDLGGFGGSTRAPGFFDRDVAAGLAHLRDVAPGLPLHLWGVSSGGYWAHPALTDTGGVAGAMFEDVSPHLLEWSWRVAPWGRPAYLFLDLRRHAAALRLGAAAYVSGGRDRGILPAETRDLAERAGARHLVVPRAEHLGAILEAPDEVVALALSTFEQAEVGASGAAEPRCRI